MLDWFKRVAGRFNISENEPLNPHELLVAIGDKLDLSTFIPWDITIDRAKQIDCTMCFGNGWNANVTNQIPKSQQYNCTLSK